MWRQLRNGVRCSGCDGVHGSGDAHQGEVDRNERPVGFCSAPVTQILSCRFAGSRQLQQMLGSAGFDAKRDIAGIVLNRWGHAYIAPQPGFYFGTPGNPAPLEVVRRRYGRVAQEARRALRQVL